MAQPKQGRGKKIEINFKQDALKQGLFFLRFKDSASSWQGGGGARFTPDNPCDCLIFKSPYLFPIELKSTVGKSFSIQRSLEDNSAMIKFHQIKSLVDMGQSENVICGFVFDIYDEKNDEETAWYLEIGRFSQFLVDSDKKSINEEDIKEYGGIEIELIKKRTWSVFKINDMIKEVSQNYGREKNGGI